MNAFKKSTCVTKHGISFAKILEATAKLPSNTNNSEDPREPTLKVLLSLSTNTIKYDFNQINRKIGELSDQKKRTDVADIVWKWGRSIVGSGACVL